VIVKKRPERRCTRGLIMLSLLCAVGFALAFCRVTLSGLLVIDRKVEERGKVEEHTEHTVHSYFLLDRTGSMHTLKKAVEDGYEAYVREQQAARGKMFFTVAQFDSQEPFEVVIEGTEIHSAPSRLSNYQPRSTTPLYDAIVSTINYAEKTSDGSADVIIVVFTDGQENASRKATRQRVFERIDAKKKLGWTFVFLGANQDSYATGGSMGYSKGSIKNYAASAAGVDYGWGTVSKAMLNQRAQRSRTGYTSADRMAAAESFFDSAKV